MDSTLQLALLTFTFCYIDTNENTAIAKHKSVSAEALCEIDWNM